MPFITVEILKGRTLDQRRAFGRRVTEAAIEELGAKPAAVRIVFRDLDPTELWRGGSLVIDEQPTTPNA